MLKELLPSLRRKKGMLLLFSLLSHFILFAQEKITVKGTVLIENNAPLGGVSINIKGSSGGTVTDADGKFSLQVNKGATLIFSSVGYKEQLLQVSSSESSLTIQMVPTASALGEVVVVSYGTQKRRDITGSISQLNVTEVKDMPVADIGQKLQGKFAGVQINQTTGEPGADISIRVRGAASINAGNNPLIVIDGFPTESGLQTLSPDEIESITVLKDASAASLYGSRAASGVILVTTKQAKAGQKSIEFSSYYGVQSVSKRGRPDLMNAPEFAEFKKEYYEDAALYEGYTGGVPVQYQNPGQYTANSGTNWFDVLLRKAPTQNYNLSIANGTRDLKSVVNLNYNRQDGVMLNNWASRFSARSNNIYIR